MASLGTTLKKWFSWQLFIGIILGAFIILVVRLVTYHPQRVHYHANFAVYINGQRELFKEAFYYEDTASNCSEEEELTPHERAHMHDNVNDVVHVHDHAVSWGQFFQNLGWDINPLFVKTPTKVYLADSDHKVTFILNGQTTDNVETTVIGDKDRLLVDYAGPGDQLQSEFNAVAKTAAAVDKSTDPASCGGSASPTFSERIKHLF